MKVEILIFSIVRDLPYLEYCLKSIKKFAAGFAGVTLVLPEQELIEFKNWKGSNFPSYEISPGSPLKLVFCRYPDDKEKGHLFHQAKKCRADFFVPNDTDFIFFMDSDCFFIDPVTPDDYITIEGKPILCIEEYAKMPERPWQEQTSRALGINSKFETMRRHGAIHHMKMFPDFRAHVESVHHIPFEEYVMGCQASFPWGYSEFNALGNFVLTSDWKKRYHFIDVGASGYPTDKMLDVWCHATPEQAQPNRYRGKFPADMTVRQIWDKLGL